MPRDSRRQSSRTDDIEVTFEPRLCIHAAYCLAGLPEVFNVEERRWIQLEHGEPDDVARVVMTCPTGALQFHRLDGGTPEEPDERYTIQPRLNGPLFVRGDIEILDGAGNVIEHVTRAALCRCGASGNKPFCDGTHRSIGFRSA